jgi:hypothetical protein
MLGSPPWLVGQATYRFFFLPFFFLATFLPIPVIESGVLKVAKPHFSHRINYIKFGE